MRGKRSICTLFFLKGTCWLGGREKLCVYYLEDWIKVLNSFSKGASDYIHYLFVAAATFLSLRFSLSPLLSALFH